jgi:hypothetical protein
MGAIQHSADVTGELQLFSTMVRACRSGAL